MNWVYTLSREGYYLYMKNNGHDEVLLFKYKYIIYFLKLTTINLALTIGVSSRVSNEKTFTICFGGTIRIIHVPSLIHCDRLELAIHIVITYLQFHLPQVVKETIDPMATTVESPRPHLECGDPYSFHWIIGYNAVCISGTSLALAVRSTDSPQIPHSQNSRI
ncbi:hypothetical protein ACJX0J_039299, partial [Zea mays]